MDKGSAVCFTHPPGTCQRPKVMNQAESEEDPELDFVGALAPACRSQAPAQPGFRAPAVLWEEKKSVFKLGQKMPFFPSVLVSPTVRRENPHQSERQRRLTWPRIRVSCCSRGNFPHSTFPSCLHCSRLASRPARYFFLAVKRWVSPNSGLEGQ